MSVKIFCFHLKKHYRAEKLIVKTFITFQSVIMVVNCLIEFTDNSQGIYTAGQIVNGKVTITCDKRKTVKGFVLF